MKKTLILTMALAALLVLVFAGAAFAGETQVVPLKAGQLTEIGTVTVSDDGASLTVTYDVTEPGWFLTTTHLYVDTKAPKKSAPGQFPYAHTGMKVTTDRFEVPITDGKTYYVAAHADVLNENNIVGYTDEIIGYDYNTIIGYTDEIIGYSDQIIGYDCPTLDELAAMLPDSVGIRAVNYPNPNSYFDLTLTGDLTVKSRHILDTLAPVGA